MTRYPAARRVQLGAGAVKIPDRILLALTHIILSHHEKPEFGAAKAPAFPEAIFVAHLDNLDANMNLVINAVDRAGSAGKELGGEFTEKQWALDGVKLWRPDPTA